MAVAVRRLGKTFIMRGRTTSESSLQPPVPMTPDGWHVYTVVIDDNHVELYVDGLLEANLAKHEALSLSSLSAEQDALSHTSPMDAIVGASSTPLVLGGDRHTKFRLSGMISAVRIFGSRLDDEVRGQVEASLARARGLSHPLFQTPPDTSPDVSTSPRVKRRRVA